MTFAVLATGVPSVVRHFATTIRCLTLSGREAHANLLSTAACSVVVPLNWVWWHRSSAASTKWFTRVGGYARTGRSTCYSRPNGTTVFVLLVSFLRCHLPPTTVARLFALVRLGQGSRAREGPSRASNRADVSIRHVSAILLASRPTFVSPNFACLLQA